MIIRRYHRAALLCLGVCLTALMTTPVRADDAPAPCRSYSGTMSTEYKLGSERDIGEIAALIPIACDNDDLVYTDIRLKGDSEDGRELNVALGIRSLQNAGIAGGYVYLDRKKSGVTDKYFTQSTIGAEWLAQGWEARANAYLPMSDEKFADSGNPGVVVGNPFLNGSGLFVNVTGLSTLREVPMGGGDVEVGYKIPHSKLWLHGAGFAFDGDGAEALYGGRARARYDLTDMLAVTAEAQHDNVRDNQGWLGLRVTVPFGTQNAAYKNTLRARMTDSPVRDVDIVTSAVEQEIPGVQQKAVLNTDTNRAQRVFHVDNSLGAAGDGSLATPYNTLAAAAAVATQAGDIIYIHSGDGTSTNMDQGITLTQNSQSIIGEGVAFTYDGTRFRTTTGEDFTGTVLRAAGVAPVLSNAIGSAAVGVSGADDVLLTGFTVDASTGTGIRLTNADNAVLDTVTVTNGAGQGIQTVYDDGGSYNSFTARNVTSSNNTNNGLRFDLTDGALANLIIEDSDFDNNAGRGVNGFISAGGRLGTLTATNVGLSANQGGTTVTVVDSGSGIDTVAFTNVTASNSTATAGIDFNLQSGTSMGNMTFDTVTTSSNATDGLAITADDADIGDITVSDLTSDSNTVRGFLVSAGNTSSIDTLTLDTLHTHSNTSSGTFINLTNGTSLNTVTASDIDSQSNSNRGFYVSAATAATLGSLSIDTLTASGNIGANGLGLDILTNGDGSEIGIITLDNITTDNNGAQGTRIFASTLGHIDSVSISNLDADSNGNTGLGIQTGNGGTLNTATVDDVISNNNATTGISFTANNVSGAVVANIASITATNLTASGNTQAGVAISALNSGVVETAHVDGVTANGNGGGGLTITSQTAGVMDDITIENATLTNNTGRGLYALANNSAINNLTLDSITANGSLGGNGHGVQVAATSGAAGTVTATLTNIMSSNNAVHGIYLQANTTASLNVVLSDSDSHDNASNGIFVDDDTTGTYTVDLGGGALGSTGNNRFFDNTGTEIRVDLDGGELKAENNWWGNVLGLQPGETTLDVGSTIDADPFLAADPRP